MQVVVVVGRSLSDGILVNRAGRGDSIAFSQLVERHYCRAAAVAAALVGNTDSAHDVAQAAFAQTSGIIASYGCAWDFYVSLYRHVLMRGFAADRQQSPKKRPDALAVGLAALPPMNRAALALRECAGFTYHQIAHILQCRVRTVRRMLSIARAALCTNVTCVPDVDACGRAGRW